MSDFNELTLWNEVVAKWGEYGAHADVLRHLMTEHQRLKDRLGKESVLAHQLAQALREHIHLNDQQSLRMATLALNDWEEAHRA